MSGKKKMRRERGVRRWSRFSRVDPIFFLSSLFTIQKSAMSRTTTTTKLVMKDLENRPHTM